jgi:hypothetical protein
MIELPDKIDVYDLKRGRAIEASLEELTRSMAQEQIDAKWWTLPGVSKSIKEQENDYSWRWAKLIGEFRNNLAWEAAAAILGNDDIEGAVLYCVDALSFIDPDQPAVYIQCLASAPHNRPWLVEQPLYRGIGEGLLLRAVIDSYRLGFGGRVTLESIDEQKTRRFYETRNFTVLPSDQDRSDIRMELTPGDAMGFLAAQGYAI